MMFLELVKTEIMQKKKEKSLECPTVYVIFFLAFSLSLLRQSIDRFVIP